MFHSRVFPIVCAVLLCGCLCGTALAAEVNCDTAYCFTAQDFSGDETVAGICITGLPEPAAGTVMLGSRVLRAGDILSADQIGQMTFHPLRTQWDKSATVSYLPIYENRVESTAVMTISIRGKEDKAPVAEDLAIETYKNLPNDGVLKVTDPEGEKLTYTVVRAPRRGTVTLREDGSFTYTPKKNKVGVDSFTYTAADPAGNVSREATVTVQILKPTDSRQYTDTVGQDCRFAAEWMRNTGLFSGETVSGQSCFFPEKTVSRGDFIAMAVKLLEIPMEETDYSMIPTDVPLWLKPYVGAAMRAGLLSGLPEEEADVFSPDSPITGGEAAVILQNALDLSVQSALSEDGDVPAWAAVAVAAMTENGMPMQYDGVLTRADVAKMLYQVKQLSVDAPGAAVLRLQEM